MISSSKNLKNREIKVKNKILIAIIVGLVGLFTGAVSSYAQEPNIPRIPPSWSWSPPWMILQNLTLQNQGPIISPWGFWGYKDVHAHGCFVVYWGGHWLRNARVSIYYVDPSGKPYPSTWKSTYTDDQGRCCLDVIIPGSLLDPFFSGLGELTIVVEYQTLWSGIKESPVTIIPISSDWVRLPSENSLRPIEDLDLNGI